VTFEEPVVVTAIVIQGGGDEGWVTKFSIKASKDGTEWLNMDEDSLTRQGNPLVFGGSIDGTSVNEVKRSSKQNLECCIRHENT